MYGHRAVLLNEALGYLEPQPGRRFIDATFGAGGHTQALLDQTAPDGKVLALDVDEASIARGREALSAYGSRLTLVKANFKDIHQVAADQQFMEVDGILADIDVL